MNVLWVIDAMLWRSFSTSAANIATHSFSKGHSSLRLHFCLPSTEDITVLSEKKKNPDSPKKGKVLWRVHIASAKQTIHEEESPGFAQCFHYSSLLIKALYQKLRDVGLTTSLRFYFHLTVCQQTAVFFNMNTVYKTSFKTSTKKYIMLWGEVRVPGFSDL